MFEIYLPWRTKIDIDSPFSKKSSEVTHDLVQSFGIIDDQEVGGIDDVGLPDSANWSIHIAVFTRGKAYIYNRNGNMVFFGDLSKANVSTLLHELSEPLIILDEAQVRKIQNHNNFDMKKPHKLPVSLLLDNLDALFIPTKMSQKEIGLESGTYIKARYENSDSIRRQQLGWVDHIIPQRKIIKPLKKYIEKQKIPIYGEPIRINFTPIKSLQKLFK